MSIIHTVEKNTYKVLVTNQDGEYYIRFHDPVTGRSQVLDRSEDREYAISSAEKFPTLYEIAQNEGFTLLEDEFVNKGRSVTVNEAFDTDRTNEEFKSLLQHLNAAN